MVSGRGESLAGVVSHAPLSPGMGNLSSFSDTKTISELRRINRAGYAVSAKTAAPGWAADTRRISTFRRKKCSEKSVCLWLQYV